MPEIAGVGVLTAFLAGIISFLSPCVLPLVPGYVSYIAGRSLDDVLGQTDVRKRLSVIYSSLFFVAGFSVVFITLGAGASVIGGFLRGYLYEAGYVAGGIIILFGLNMMGLLRFDWMNRDLRFNKPAPSGGGGPVGSFFLGTAFAFGWTPCIGPILGAILTIGATTMNVSDGVALLSIYSLGLAIPFVLVAAFTDRFMAKSKAIKRIGRPLQSVAGGVLILVGIGMATGYLNSAGTWLLNNVPFFQSLVL